MIVFVHGVPETAQMWDEVRGLVDEESIALALPGFGCPRPDGFGATMDDYLAWLAGELRAIEGPIDLVGHDWGAALVYGIANAHGDLLRSWAADCGNIAHPEYEWHDIGKLWQAAGDGEAFFEAQRATPVEQRVELFEAIGVPRDGARQMVEAGDATMEACILALYRSALPNPCARWGPWRPTVAAGLVLAATADPFSDETLAAETAEMLGADFARMEGVGHFWPYEAPEKGVAILERFWASLRA